MTQEDKKTVLDALEELKGDCVGIIAATIEDCQKVVRELPEKECNCKDPISNEKIISDLYKCAMNVDLRYSFLLGTAAGRIRDQEERIHTQKEIIQTQNERIAAAEMILNNVRAALEGDQ